MWPSCKRSPSALLNVRKVDVLRNGDDCLEAGPDAAGTDTNPTRERGTLAEDFVDASGPLARARVGMGTAIGERTTFLTLNKPMIEAQLPLSWEAPDWHADFGDTRAEFEHLRSLAEAVLSSNPRAKVELVLPEPGLMYLELVSPGGPLAEAYSVNDPRAVDNRRYALFLLPGTSREQELYADSIHEVLELLGSQWKSKSGDKASASSRET